MTHPQLDLADLFAVAQQTIAVHEREINDLNGHNGNHGDNVAQNGQLIVDALQQRRDHRCRSGPGRRPDGLTAG